MMKQALLQECLVLPTSRVRVHQTEFCQVMVVFGFGHNVVYHRVQIQNIMVCVGPSRSRTARLLYRFGSGSKHQDEASTAIRDA